MISLEEEQRLTVVQEDIFRGRAELQGAENLLEFQRREIASLEAQSGRLSEELVLLQRQIADAEAEKALLELRRREFSSSSLGEEEALEQKERQLEELAAAERVASLTLDDCRKRLFGLIGEISQAGNQQAAAAKRLDQLAERVQRSTNEEQSLKGLLVQAEEQCCRPSDKTACRAVAACRPDRIDSHGIGRGRGGKSFTGRH